MFPTKYLEKHTETMHHRWCTNSVVIATPYTTTHEQRHAKRGAPSTVHRDAHSTMNKNDALTKRQIQRRTNMAPTEHWAHLEHFIFTDNGTLSVTLQQRHKGPTQLQQHVYSGSLTWRSNLDFWSDRPIDHGFVTGNISFTRLGRCSYSFSGHKQYSINTNCTAY